MKATSMELHDGTPSSSSCLTSSSTSSLGVSPIAFARRGFYSGLDDKRVHRLRRSSMMFNRLRGRDSVSLQFEKRVTLKPFVDFSDLYRGLDERSDIAIVCPISNLSVDAPIAFPSPFPIQYDTRYFPLCETDVTETHDTSPTTAAVAPHFSHDLRRFLRKDCDSASVFQKAATRNGATPLEEKKSVSHCCWVFIVDPIADRPQYRKEEAQVELITAYRNALVEISESPTLVQTIRIPVFSVDNAVSQTRWVEEDLGKLTQQSIIKAFHRIPTETKELLMSNPMFTVELYIPLEKLPSFQQAFLEEAWETPRSVLAPGRLNLYPGLAPPKEMKNLPGWVGKRPELLEAIETEGRSLESKAQLTLDGRTVAISDQHAEVDVTGSRTFTQRMLVKEAESAKASGLSKEVDSSLPLHTGIGNIRSVVKEKREG